MNDISPYLLEPPQFQELLKSPGIWRGLARARDAHDPLKAVYERIALQLAQGADPTKIPEIDQWLLRKAIWPSKDCA